MSISVVPTADQVAMMLTTFEESEITESPGTIGMFGQDNDYYFYMTFEAYQSDQWWSASVQVKTFRLLFQMGDSLSDWTGIQKTFTAGTSANTQV